MAASWILLIFFIGVFLFLGWYFGSKQNQWVFPDPTKDPLEDCSGKEQRIELPLIFDPYNGIYRTKIHLGDENNSIRFDVVPDTGSSILIVSGPECANCPRQDGVWNYSLGRRAGSQGVIRYGGGQETRYIPWRALLRDYDRPDDATDGPGKEVDFGVITSTLSPDGRPLNVLGLQGEGPGFLAGVCGEKTVIFDFVHSKLYLGKSDDVLSRAAFKRTFKLLKPPAGPAYILARIKSMKINGNPVPAGIMPEYAVLDTGTTNSIVSPGLGQLLRNPAQVEITFDNGDTTGSSVVFSSTPSNVDVDRIYVPNAMMIGNQWLKNYGIGFLHDQDQIVIFQ